MSPPESWTVKRLLEWTTEHFKKHGSDSPRLDAEILLAAALGCTRIDLYVSFAREPTGDERTRFRETVKRRATGEPVAYLVGHKEFYSLSFEVTRDTLIPRPETEHLVVESLDLLAKMGRRDDLSVCDVGTGSGAIAVAIAKNAPKCRVTAVDISPEALDVAKSNAETHGVTDRVTFVISDLLAEFPETPLFDLVVSNPPYVSESEFANLPADVRNFEPKLALVAGKEGTSVIRELATQAVSRLREGGHFLVELSPMTAGQVAEMLQKQGWRDVRLRRDQAGHDRIAAARK